MRDFLSPVFAFILGGLVVSFAYYNKPHFKVGECVRDLGHEVVETITYVTDGGAIETKWPNTYSNGFSSYVYDNGNRLVKVSCP